MGSVTSPFETAMLGVPTSPFETSAVSESPDPTDPTVPTVPTHHASVSPEEPDAALGVELPPEGVAPLQSRARTGIAKDELSVQYPGGFAPFGKGESFVADLPPDPTAPFGKFSPIRGEALDRRTTRIVRVDLLFGPAWRGTQTDAMIATSVEVGPMHGFACSFHTSVLISMDRDFVRVVDVPIGVGALVRGKLRNKPLYGSLGLTVGILVERAADDTQVVHRVDPDFRLPMRLAWTIAGAGLSLSVIPGYSVRSRVYERRGVELWERSAYRIGVALGMHFDAAAGRAWLVTRYRQRRHGGHAAQGDKT